MIDFDKISELSMLSVSNMEKESLRRDIENIIAFADKISEFEEIGELLEFSNTASDKLREDIPKQSSDRNAILSNSPKVSEGFISVPKSF